MQNKNKTNLCLVYGGPSSEHEVSIKSFNNIYENIENSKIKNDLNLIVVYISKKGDWQVKKSIGKFSKGISLLNILKYLRQNDFLIWPIMHGEYGEDGVFQKICEKNKLRYIGSDAAVSKTAINKILTQNILEKSGIKCPKSILLNTKNFEVGLEKIKSNFSFPIIFKPVDLGSSVGLVKIEKIENLKKETEKYFKKFNKVLVQEFISGREFTCGVFDIKNKSKALVATEVILKNSKTFDYKTKYTVGACEEITPANVSSKLMNEIKNKAIKVHQLVGCRDISRTDMILDKNGKLIVLEINTLPGMTKTSFIPQQLSYKGISIEKFIRIILKNYLSKSSL
jgi:D-alanine-D-alanine ligase